MRLLWTKRIHVCACPVSAMKCQLQFWPLDREEVVAETSQGLASLLIKSGKEPEALDRHSHGSSSSSGPDWLCDLR